MDLETLRAYTPALNGYVDSTGSVGPHSIKVTCTAKTDNRRLAAED